VAYSCSTDGIRFKALSPLEASIAPFLDGTLTKNELETVWFQIHSHLNTKGEEKKLRQRLTNVLSRLTDSGILTQNGSVSPSLGGESHQSLIPCLSNYDLPRGRLDRPLGVNIALTNRCVTDCRYCYAERNKCRELSISQLCTIFDELVANEIYIVDITGGDLFARADVLDVLAEMVKRQFVFFVSTKSYISPEVSERLSCMGIGKPELDQHHIRPLQFSVDSADHTTASYLVRRPNYLESTVKSIKNVIRAGCSPRVKSVLTSRNANGVEDVVELFANLGVCDFQFVQYGRSYFRHDDSLFLTFEQKKGLLETTNTLKVRFPHITISVQEDTSFGGVRRSTWDQWRQRAVCSGGRTNMVVKPNGDVTLCDQMPHRREYVMGNVLTQGVLNVWNSPLVHSFNNPSKNSFAGTACFSCSEFDACHDDSQGYCYRDALFAYGTIYEAPPDCPEQKRIGLRQI
jgi:radical SAM protein with 4Fe4S-binding SPASM domain